MKRGFFALAWVAGLIGLGALIWRNEGALRALEGRIASLEETPSAGGVEAGLPQPREVSTLTQTEEFAVLSRRVGELARRVDTLALAIKSQSPASAVYEVPEQPTESKAPDLLQEPPDPAALERIEAAQWANIQRRFLDEPVDRTWGPSTEARVYSSFANDEVLRDVGLNVVECRSQGCRLSWQYPHGLTSEESFILENTFSAALAKAGLNTVTTRGDTAGGLEAYAFRSQEAGSDGGTERP